MLDHSGPSIDNKSLAESVLISYVPSVAPPCCSVPSLLQANRGSVSYEPLSEGQVTEIQRQVHQFTEGTIPEIEVEFCMQAFNGIGESKYTCIACTLESLVLFLM